jgi:hypothetical protein
VKAPIGKKNLILVKLEVIIIIREKIKLIVGIEARWNKLKMSQ